MVLTKGGKGGMTSSDVVSVTTVGRIVGRTKTGVANRRTKRRKRRSGQPQIARFDALFYSQHIPAFCATPAGWNMRRTRATRPFVRKNARINDRLRALRKRR